ncbi:Toxin ParE1 [Vibrio aerogenes CECT 7868]|uniref:Toxin n=1 Tax=Vibrio aerogenes CECT 7868 TaxID=1216006 RepID=A0A1M5VIB1_9VIBR|nr:type II toxin-antitoxin system RelE/ParE family toxin [Vibrio aerogenes]SHH74986.1 Toxin ParE1 [Vibrio aerogenes CECT 7868]
MSVTPFIRPLARQDMLDIWQYTCDKWGRRQADRYLRELAEKLSVLAGMPELGRAADYIFSGLRVYHFRHHIVLYQITATHIDIIRVLHERMDVTQHPLS